MKPPEYLESNDEEFFLPLCEILSLCCGAKSLGDIEEDCYGNLVGVCSECHQQASFKQEAPSE